MKAGDRLRPCRYYRIDPGEILIAHDELDIPAGEARFSTTGVTGATTGSFPRGGYRDFWPTHWYRSSRLRKKRVGLGIE